VKNYFETKFAAQPRMEMSLDGIPFKCISEEDNDMICKEFNEQEILEAVSQCGSSKSLGLDGYNFYFIKNNWEEVGPDMLLSLR